MPIKIHKKEFRFTQIYEVTYTREKLQEKLRLEIEEKLKKDGVADYKIISEEIKETKTGITLTQIVTSEENIAVNEDLIISSNKP